MRERANYLRRLCGTAFSFFLFGAVGVLFWGVFFPLAAPFIGQGQQKKQTSRDWMHRLFRFYMNLMRWIGILAYEVQGGEKLNAPGRLVIANHPSLLDVVFLISQIRNATCIVKPTKAANPFLRIPIQAMGYIYAEDPEVLLDRCAEELREGGSLIVFPEGTRTTPGQRLKFQRGAAAIALHTGATILPVYISCSPTTLTKRDKWYQIPEKKFTLKLCVGNDIEPEPLEPNTSRGIASRNLTRRLEHYFTGQMAQHGKP